MENQYIKEQKDILNEIDGIADHLQLAADKISVNVKVQAKTTEQMNKEMEDSLNRMGFVMKKLGTLLETSDASSICTVLALIGLFMLMLVLVLFA